MNFKLYNLFQTYTKFKGIPLKISTKGNPHHSPTGFLPYLKNNNEIIAGYDAIMAIFRSMVVFTIHY